MKLKILFLLLVTAVAVPAMAHAQTALYAEFTGASLNQANSPHIYGGTFGLYTQKTFKIAALGGDLRGFALSGSGQTYNGVLVGPRVALKPRVIPLMPYAELLFGITHVEEGQGAAYGSSTGAAIQGVLGLDYTVIPHVDWRVIEYVPYGKQSSGHGLDYQALSTGVVVRF